MDLVLACQHGALSRRLIGQVHLLFLGHQAHHAHDLLQNRQHVHPHRRLQHAVVQPGQPQQVLRDAAEALGLRADVRYKFPGGGRVDVLRLQNGVRQKADGGQGRFELMGSIGDEAPPGVLRGLEPVGEAVELLGDLGDLVPPPDVSPVAVGALPHLADGREQLADLAGQRPGQPSAQAHHHHGDDAGQAQKIGAEPLQQRSLLRVVFIGVYRADDLALVQYRRGGPAAERRVLIPAGEGVVAQQGLHHLRIEGVLPYGAAGLPGIVEDPAGAVRHQDAGKPRLLHHCHSLGHVLLRQLVQSAQGVDHHGHAGLEGGGLGAEHQILGYQQRIGVEQHQHRRDAQNVTQAELDLQAVEKPALTL